MTMNTLEDYNKCANDLVHFAENHLKITNQIHGEMKFSLNDTQREMLDYFDSNKKSSILTQRQVGKSSLLLVYALHKILFTPNTHVKFVVTDSDNMLMSRIRMEKHIESLPPFLCPAYEIDKDKGVISLQNNSVIYFDDCISGDVYDKYSLVILDEFAFMDLGEDEEKVISSFSDSSQHIFVSTPNEEKEGFANLGSGHEANKGQKIIAKINHATR